MQSKLDGCSGFAKPFGLKGSLLKACRESARLFSLQHSLLNLVEGRLVVKRVGGLRKLIGPVLTIAKCIGCL